MSTDFALQRNAVVRSLPASMRRGTGEDFPHSWLDWRFSVAMDKLFRPSATPEARKVQQQELKDPAASCGESFRPYGKRIFNIRSLTPKQASGNALAVGFISAFVAAFSPPLRLRPVAFAGKAAR